MQCSNPSLFSKCHVKHNLREGCFHELVLCGAGALCLSSFSPFKREEMAEAGGRGRKKPAGVESEAIGEEEGGAGKDKRHFC